MNINLLKPPKHNKICNGEDVFNESTLPTSVRFNIVPIVLEYISQMHRYVKPARLLVCRQPAVLYTRITNVISFYTTSVTGPQTSPSKHKYLLLLLARKLVSIL